jgi:uncharacterized membrane protein
MTTGSLESNEQPETGRVEAFSDGVMAIAITLLVLELHAPTERGRFLHELAHEWGAYIAYLAAFAIIGVVWLTHHAMFRRLKSVNSALMSLNLLYLLLTSVLPWPTSVISSAMRTGDHNDQVVALVLFSAISLALSASWLGLCFFVERNPHLLKDPAAAVTIRTERRMQLAAFAPAIVAIPVAFASPVVALLMHAVTPLVYLATLFRTEQPPRQAGRLLR